MRFMFIRKWLVPSCLGISLLGVVLSKPAFGQHSCDRGYGSGYSNGYGSGYGHGYGSTYGYPSQGYYGQSSPIPYQSGYGNASYLPPTMYAPYPSMPYAGGYPLAAPIPTQSFHSNGVNYSHPHRSQHGWHLGHYLLGN
jgi:hypothetical protein